MPPRKRARSRPDTPATAAIDLGPIVQLNDVPCPFSDAFQELFNTGELCDGTVNVGVREFKVSCMCLAAASRYFRATFSSPMREGAARTVDLSDRDLHIETIESLLRFAHTGLLVAHESLIEDLVSAADQLEFLSVLPLTIPHLIKTLSPSNSLQRLAFADRHGSFPELSVKARKVVDGNFAAIVKSEAFLEMPHTALQGLLADDDLCTPEFELYEALVTWHAHQPSRDFASLFEYIRLHYLGAAYLQDKVMFSPAMATPAAQTRFKNALMWLTLPEKRADLVAPQPRCGGKYMNLRFQPNVFFRWGTGENDGKTMARLAGVTWRGTLATQVVTPYANRWKLRVLRYPSSVPSSHGCWMGLGKRGIDVHTMSYDDCVGIDVWHLCRGDTFTFTADLATGQLNYKAEPCQRPRICGLDDQLEGSLAFDPTCDWLPFVSMNVAMTLEVLDENESESPLTLPESHLRPHFVFNPQSDSDDDSDDSDDDSDDG